MGNSVRLQAGLRKNKSTVNNRRHIQNEINVNEGYGSEDSLLPVWLDSERLFVGGLIDLKGTGSRLAIEEHACN